MDVRRGSCLCGRVTFSVTGPIRGGVGCCHCSKCRKVSGSNGNAQFIVPLEAFRWLGGETEVLRWRRPDGWGIDRCATCGSLLPASIDGARIWVPAGLMDDPLDTEMRVHIFCGSRADWDVESPQAQHFDAYPPGWNR